MKLILILSILYLINTSNAAWWSGTDEDTDQDTDQDTNTDTVASTQLSANSDILVDNDISPKSNDQSQDGNDNNEENNDPNQSENTESSTIQSPVEEPVNRMPDVNQQNKVSGERMPEPDYRSVNVRDFIPACHGGQYQCQKTDPSQQQLRCIPQEWRCNGLRDCENNDDESGCSQDQLNRGRTQDKCSPDQHQCHGLPPVCIDKRLVCDGTYQCSYGDDEANCPERRDERRDERREHHHYHNQNRDQRRPDNSIDANTQNSINRPQDSRDTYRPQNVPNTNPDRKNDEYVQRLEWRDRCFRSCLKY